jgi:hypothetical protein
MRPIAFVDPGAFLDIYPFAIFRLARGPRTGKERFEHRMLRLERKAGRSLLDALDV